MAKNLIMKHGRYQEWTVAGKSSGDPVVNGNMTGVAQTDSDATTNKLTVDMAGVYYLSVKAINNAGNSAVAIGDKIFYVAGDTPLLSKKATGVFFGFALEAIATGQTATIKVLQIMGTDGAVGLENEITDPGDASAIPVSESGVCPITTAAAETRTLAAPSRIGQQLVLTLDVDGGDCVITVASAINQTGNTVITMGDAGDTIKLVGTQVGGSLVWRAEFNDGCALSTP